MQIATSFGLHWPADGLAVALVAAILVAMAAIGARRIGDDRATPN